VPPLDDPEHVRHKLLFSCGTLYNFETDTFRRGERSDRIQRHLPWAFEDAAWDPAVCELVRGKGGLFETLDLFYKNGGRSIVAGARGENVEDALRGQQAQRVQGIMQKLAAADAFVKFLLDWTMDIDEALLWLKWLTRGASSHARFCEAIWLVGAAQGGKDIIVALVMAFGGSASDGIVASLKWRYVTSRHGGTESCAPFLRSCSSARFILVSEVPNERVSMTLLKPLCEQRGAPIQARTLYEGSYSFRPMALPLITSNFTPKLHQDEADDSGAQSRIRVYSTTAVYTKGLQKLPTEKRADVELADVVNSGRFNSSLFALMRGFHGLLDYSPETRNVGPLPPRVQQETEECFSSGMFGQPPLFAQWVTRYVRPAASPVEASSTGAVYKSAVNAVGEQQGTMVRALLTSSGFYQDASTRVSGKRYYTKIFKEGESPRPVRIIEADGR